jgi:hypothetical protein
MQLFPQPRNAALAKGFTLESSDGSGTQRPGVLKAWGYTRVRRTVLLKVFRMKRAAETKSTLAG